MLFDICTAIILIVDFPNFPYVRHVSSLFRDLPAYLVRVCRLPCGGPCLYDGRYYIMLFYCIAHLVMYVFYI